MENKLEMDRLDLAAFLCELGNRLKKEGHALQSLSKIWFEESGDEYYILRQTGIDISNMAKQLLFLRQQLCNNCKMKDVSTFLTVEDSRAEEKKE